MSGQTQAAGENSRTPGSTEGSVAQQFVLSQGCLNTCVLFSLESMQTEGQKSCVCVVTVPRIYVTFTEKTRCWCHWSREPPFDVCYRLDVSGGENVSYSKPGPSAVWPAYFDSDMLRSLQF